MRIVYYDERYTGSWIDGNWSREIADYLEKHNFERKNAEELKEWLKSIVRDGDAYRSVVVFSKDMMPETVLDPLNSPNSLIRKYLDLGGRIVWIGDIPFWCKARENNRIEIWRAGVPFAMLGVDPLIAEASCKCLWIGDWKKRMISRWYSQRPINIDKDSWLYRLGETRLSLRIKVLAIARVTLLPTGWNWLVITRWKKAGKKVGRVRVKIPGTGVEIEWVERFPEELSYKPLTLACAWHVIFNREYPSQGFYRFWDCGVTVSEPPKELLKDILTLATYRLDG